MKTKLSGILTLLLVLVVQITFAQQKTVSGNVTDETGPLPGVSIIIDGTMTGTETDFDGNYSINANVGAVLKYSFVGMTTVTRTVNAGSSIINVEMLAADNTLEEVVITGYASVKKSELTGSSVQIKEAEIQQFPTPSVDQVLQGKVAGLTISGTSGTPGSSQNIRIRGISSITAGNEPLFVIDGVPVVNEDVQASAASSSLSPLSSLNNNNIASVTVLKDASATAAYGARGANGVIVITTKQGKKGKTNFNFSASAGFQNDAIEGPKMLKASEQEELYYEALFNTYGEQFQFGRDEAMDFYKDNPNFFGDDWTVWNENGRQEGNWADVITNKNALLQDYNFSASGGDEVSSFYAALGYYGADATVIGSSFRRYNGNLNYSRSFGENFNFSTTNSVANTLQDGLLETSAYFASPRTAKYFMTPRAQPYNADGSINIDDIRATTSVRNPIWIAENDINENRLTRFLSNNSLSWNTPIENLRFTTRLAMDYLIYNDKTYQNRIHGDGQSTNGYAYRANRENFNYVFQNSLDYILTAGDDHTFTLQAIQEFQKNKTYFLSADGEQFAADGLTNLASAGSPTSAFSSFTDWAIASYKGLFNYSYQGKYILNATYALEGNSRFPYDNRWGNFWSVGAAWNIARENFLVNSSVINNLKLRASYGVTGNAQIGLNTYQSLLSYDADYANSAAVYPSTYGNPNLTWETQNTLDAGLDFGFFDNRISGVFSYYYRESTDLLQEVPLTRTSGFASQNANIGSMYNTGYELEMNFDIVRSEDFNLSIGGYISTNENEVTKLALDPEGNPITITTGTRRVDVDHTVYEWYMRKWAGIDPATGVDTYYLNGKDGETTTDYNAAERDFQGKGALPTFTSGMNFHVDFKGFFFDAQGYYASGHKIYEDWTRYIHASDRYNFELFNSINTLMDRWQEPGDITDVAKVTYTIEPWRTSTKYLFDGDYFRLRNITFGYDFQQKFVEPMGISSLRLFVRGVNQFTWVKDDRMTYDPEVEANGFTSLTTPPVKSLVFGININF